MATELVGSKQTIYQEDVDFLSANSEALQTKIAKAALFAQNISEYPVNFSYPGYFVDGETSDGRVSYIVTKRSEIKRYFMSVGTTGTAGTTSINIRVYDADGAFVNDLFSSGAGECQISRTGATVNNFWVSRNIDESSTDKSTQAGVTTQFGTPNITTLEEGYQLKGEIYSNGTLALHANLGLILQRLE